MVSIERSFKILVIDENETDVKIVKRVIAKDYKSVDVVAKSGTVDWKAFFKGNKFDLLLFNYVAGSLINLPEIKKIIAADETLPIYIMIWQHEIEIGMKAVYQGAEGFIIKDKTYLNLKKLVQRHLSNYFVSIDLAASQEINEILAEDINDGFFKFTKDGELEYISEKFIHMLGFETDFEISTNVSDLFTQINNNINKTGELNKGMSFLFETNGKDNIHFWFQVYVYKKFDMKNDTLYFEGILKNVTETKTIEKTLSDLKKENELLINNVPLPIEIYNKAGKKISSNDAFSKMLLDTSIAGKDSVSKIDLSYLLQDSNAKAVKTKSFNLDNQKVLFGNTQKYFNISYFASILNPDNIYAVYNDITETVGYKNEIFNNLYNKKALFSSIDVGCIEINLADEIIDISDRTISILGKNNANYVNTSIYKFLDMVPSETLTFAFQESKRLRFHSFIVNAVLRISIQLVINAENEHIGYIIIVENKEQLIKLEETSMSNADRINLLSEIRNVFLWVGVISEEGVKPEYCTKGMTYFTGYSMNEIMEKNSKATNYLFDINKGDSLGKIIKYIDSNIHQEKNLIDRKGNIKRIKIKFHIRKLQTTTYRISAIVEDITELSSQRDDYVSFLLSINNIIASEESLFFKMDDSFVVQEIYHCSKQFEKDIALNDKFQSLEKVEPNLIVETLGETLIKDTASETVLFSKSNNKKFKIFLLPHISYAKQKFLYVYIQDVTNIENIKNDYNYYSKLFDSVKEINNTLVLILENDKIIFANEAIKNFVNYKEENINGLNISHLFADDSYKEGFSNQLPKANKKKPIELLLNLKDKNDNQKICKFDVSIISGTEYPERVFLIGSDETKEQYLRNDIAYKSGIQNILSVSETDAIIIWHDNEVIYHNKHSLTLFGYSDKEIRELNKFDLFSPIQTNNVMDIIRRLFSDTSPDTMNDNVFDVVCKKNNGEEFYAKVSVSKHLIFSNIVFVLTVTDNSEKKQLQNIIQLLNNKTDSLIASLTEGIWIFDKEYKIIYSSHKALKYLEYSSEDVQEKRIFYFIKDEIAGFDKHYFEESPESMYLNISLFFIKKSGSFLPCFVNIIPLRNEKSQFIGGILSMLDLSDIFERDDKIEELNENNLKLDKQIVSLTKDLDDTKKSTDKHKSEAEKLIHSLEEKMESTESVHNKLNVSNKQIMRLYMLIQSNLKGQISNIRGFCDFMNKVWNKITPEQQLEYFNILLTNSEQASYTFDKISLLSKLISNKVTIQREIIELSTKIEKILKLKQDKFKTKNILVDYKINETCYFSSDETLIDFILNEILSNSLKYTAQNGKVEIELFKVSDIITLSIRDNGIGIAQDKLNNIFDYSEPSQFNNVKIKAGSGVSLFMVREILKLHKGNIEITSKQEKGTNITITLPSDKRIIRFVGSESNSEIMKNYLNSHYPDFSFVFSYDVVDLIDEVSYGLEPSVIFLTAFLPETEFITYVEKLRSIYNKFVVIVSSECSDELKSKLLMNNIFTFISLPLHEDDIQNILARIIHK
jgi:PAS domain S-box-containing protein